MTYDRNSLAAQLDAAEACLLLGEVAGAIGHLIRAQYLLGRASKDGTSIMEFSACTVRAARVQMDVTTFVQLLEAGRGAA